VSASVLRHVENRSSYQLTVGPLSAVVAHTSAGEREVEIRWQCTQLAMSRSAAFDLWERLSETLGTGSYDLSLQCRGLQEQVVALEAERDAREAM
jgi:hypothetical protein